MKEVKDVNGKVVAQLLNDEDVPYKLEDTVAVIGYGSQGHAQAQNFRDSGVKVILGLIRDKSWEKAVQDGWKEGENLFEVDEAAKRADIIHMLIPDTEQKAVYQQIKKYLKPGKALSFSHGYNIVYKLIKPSADVDVIMVAPKGPGVIVREEYKKGFGVPCLFAIEQDASGKARQRVLGMAKAAGFTRPGALETTFNNETETDLFGEQVDLCGGITELVNKAFETLIEDGRNPVLAYWEVSHELFGLIAPLAYKYGCTGMLRRVSLTARDGALESGKIVIDEKTKKKMKKVLDKIKSGKYAKGWNKRYKEKGIAAVTEPVDEMDKSLYEQVGKQVRKIMWKTDDVS